jgi:hypothetical protein
MHLISVHLSLLPSLLSLMSLLLAVSFTNSMPLLILNLYTSTLLSVFMPLMYLYYSMLHLVLSHLLHSLLSSLYLLLLLSLTYLLDLVILNLIPLSSMYPTYIMLMSSHLLLLSFHAYMFTLHLHLLFTIILLMLIHDYPYYTICNMSCSHLSLDFHSLAFHYYL